MTDREKMIETMNAAEMERCFVTPCGSCKYKDEGCCLLGLYADALVEAGIGNIRETEHRDEVAERTAMVLAKWWANETDYSWKTWFNAAQKQAEKEIAEEKGE